MPGEPLLLQKFKVSRARNRGAILRLVRCKLDLHNPPHNEVFDELGSLHIGGACTRCDDGDYRVVCYIGDIWDFPDGISQQGNSTTVHNQAMSEVVNNYMKNVLHSPE